MKKILLFIMLWVIALAMYPASSPPLPKPTDNLVTVPSETEQPDECQGECTCPNTTTECKEEHPT